MTLLTVFGRWRVRALVLGLPSVSLDATKGRGRANSGQQAGVTLATNASLQVSSDLENPQRKLSADAGHPPWRLNPVYHEKHAVTRDGRMTANLGIHDTLVQWLQRTP